MIILALLPDGDPFDYIQLLIVYNFNLYDIYFSNLPIIQSHIDVQYMLAEWVNEKINQQCK